MLLELKDYPMTSSQFKDCEMDGTKRTGSVCSIQTSTSWIPAH